MTLLFTGWVKHISLSCLTETLLLSVTKDVFKRLDWGELRVKQLLAAEIKKLEGGESDDVDLQRILSDLLGEFPEIRAL